MVSQVELAVHSALDAFTVGLEGSCPEVAVVNMASRIAKAALDKTVEPEITVDVDGALSFDLRLANGQLVLAELETGGELDASVYDEHGTLVRRLRKATETDLIELF